jgi:hypothetical protein
MKKLSVFEWHTQFKAGKEDVQDGPRPCLSSIIREDTKTLTWKEDVQDGPRPCLSSIIRDDTKTLT